VTTPTKATEQHQQRQVGRNARLYGNAVMEISRGFVGGQPNKGKSQKKLSRNYPDLSLRAIARQSRSYA